MGLDLPSLTSPQYPSYTEMQTARLTGATWVRNKLPHHDHDPLLLRHFMKGLASTSIRTIHHCAPFQNHSFSSAYDTDRSCSLWRRTASLAFCSITSGIAGYSLCSRNDSNSLTVLDSTGEHKDEEPRFGTPEDFGMAIRELMETFTEDGVVSTDPEDLHIHGFSEYDYHAGQCIT